MDIEQERKDLARARNSSLTKGLLGLILRKLELSGTSGNKQPMQLMKRMFVIIRLMRMNSKDG